MKINSTVTLTFTLLVMMLGAGVTSGFWSYTLGSTALKGVTQPDVSPTKKLAGDSAEEASAGKSLIIPENEILNKVNSHITKSKNTAKSDSSKTEGDSFIEPTNSADDSTLEVKAVDGESQVKLPIKSEDQGVLLEVVNITKKGGSLLLDVNLKNDGVKAVRFLYSFLEVKDEKGRSLSAITDGLPGEVPANNVNFSGTVKIPTALLENAKKLSLTLTDYPDQKLELKLADIPVVE